MMTLSYDVHGMSLHETTRPGPQVIGLTASHIQLGGNATVSRVSAQVSADGGKTWRPAKVTSAGSGRFRISFTATAGTNVTLRVSASDASGGSITETIPNAYRVHDRHAASSSRQPLPGPGWQRRDQRISALPLTG